MEFEEHPWLLVPIIIATVEVWSLIKAAIRSRLAARAGGSDQSSPAT